tara:strand:- start:554 stop:937 length:384 start_codon:yes stop_codon:yes gene_type:complete
MTSILKYLSIATIILSQSTLAATVSMVNNTKTKMDLEFSYCNDHNFCSHTANYTLNKKGDASNSYTIMLPNDMHKLQITSAKIYDENNNLTASLAKSCNNAGRETSTIVLDSYGTSKIHCLSVDVKA